MDVYRVGGSVRDELLGLPVADRDWVVVGQTPESMIAAGFQPVGKDFPVFLHPQTREEYALARTERKTAPGYRGFAVHFEPGVTLEDDLARRDLTVNAMALRTDGTLVDPFGGRRDLEDRMLRHVTGAFAEDPLRILRVARFCARFTDFAVAPETMALMRQMVAHGEAAALVPERVWQELSRGLMESRPSRMLAVLEDCGAMPVLLPAYAVLPAAAKAGAVQALDRAAARAEPLAVRLAVWFADLGADAACAAAGAIRAPNAVRELAVRLADEVALAGVPAGNQRSDRSSPEAAAKAWFAGLVTADPAALLGLLVRSDAWRRGGRLDGLLRAQAARADLPIDHPGARRLRAALAAANAVDQGAIAARHPGRPLEIRDAVMAARLAAIAALDER